MVGAHRPKREFSIIFPKSPLAATRVQLKKKSHKYNLFKIPKDKEPLLVSKLANVGLTVAGFRESSGYKLTMYISDKPDELPVWWAEVYASYLGNRRDEVKNMTYYAVFLVSGPGTCYAVSMGKTHFYLQEFCDLDFGVKMAERIALGRVRLKHVRLHGGNRTKAITVYQPETDLDFDSGESVCYLKARTTDAAKWGGMASFGTSVQFNLPVEPDELPRFISQVEAVLNEEPRHKIPRSETIRDKTLEEKLDQRLVAAIQGESGSQVQPEEAGLSGVEFIFSDMSEYRIYLRGHGGRNVDGALTLQDLQDFVREKQIDLATNLNDIKVRARSEQSRGYTKPVKYFLDYVDEERYFLQGGKWHRFNENYLLRLKEQVDSIKLDTQEGADFSRTEYEQWKAGLPATRRRGPTYPEYYFNELRQQEGYELLDRQLTGIQGQYLLELADLHKGETVFHVKFGIPQRLAYVFDQSIAAMRAIKKLGVAFTLGKRKVEPKNFGLWLVLDRKSKVTRLSDIESLIFLMKVADWRRVCRDLGFEPAVCVSYVKE